MVAKTKFINCFDRNIVHVILISSTLINDSKLASDVLIVCFELKMCNFFKIQIRLIYFITTRFTSC